jgi:nucleotide-binding universal stress UspA family protein
MKRFKNILVVVDDEEEHEGTINRAVQLAINNRAALTLASVMENIPHQLQKLVKSKMSKDLHEDVFQWHLARLEDLLVPIREKGVQASAKVLTGKPFLEIIREVLRSGRDLVMMPQERGIGLSDSVFGSTSLHLLRKCPCPVWIIKREQHGNFARILVAIDPSVYPEGKYDPSKDELSIKLLEIGSSLANAEGGEIYIFHAWSVLYENHIRSQAGLSEEEIEKLFLNTKKEHAKRIFELVAKHAPEVDKNCIYVRRGVAGRLIAEIARHKNIELIIMGTVGRTGISGLLIGNTAEMILNNVDCSVLAVKPDGFVSPVKIDG